MAGQVALEDELQIVRGEGTLWAQGDWFLLFRHLSRYKYWSFEGVGSVGP